MLDSFPNPPHPRLDESVPAGAAVTSPGSPPGVVVVEAGDNGGSGNAVVYYPSTGLHGEVPAAHLTVARWPAESMPNEVAVFVYPSTGRWFDVNLVVAASQPGMRASDLIATVKVSGKSLALKIARKLAYGMVAQGAGGAQVYADDELAGSYGIARRYLAEDPDAATLANGPGDFDRYVAHQREAVRARRAFTVEVPHRVRWFDAKVIPKGADGWVAVPDLDDAQSRDAWNAVVRAVGKEAATQAMVDAAGDALSMATSPYGAAAGRSETFANDGRTGLPWNYLPSEVVVFALDGDVQLVTAVALDGPGEGHVVKVAVMDSPASALHVAHTIAKSFAEHGVGRVDVVTLPDGEERGAYAANGHGHATFANGYRALTASEREALVAYAAQHGRKWRSDLRRDWASGRASGDLQRLRNDLGPSGLAGVSLGNDRRRARRAPVPAGSLAYVGGMSAGSIGMRGGKILCLVLVSDDATGVAYVWDPSQGEGFAAQSADMSPTAWPYQPPRVAVRVMRNDELSERLAEANREVPPEMREMMELMRMSGEHWDVDIRAVDGHDRGAHMGHFHETSRAAAVMRAERFAAGVVAQGAPGAVVIDGAGAVISSFGDVDGMVDVDAGDSRTLNNHHGRPEEHAVGDPLGVYMPPLAQWDAYDGGLRRFWMHPVTMWNFEVIEQHARGPGHFVGYVQQRKAPWELFHTPVLRSAEEAYAALRDWYAAQRLEDYRVVRDDSDKFLGPLIWHERVSHANGRRALTAPEREALAAYAAQRGRNWRSDLRRDWASGRASGDLQRLRNDLGPSGLARVSLANHRLLRQDTTFRGHNVAEYHVKPEGRFRFGSKVRVEWWGGPVYRAEDADGVPTYWSSRAEAEASSPGAIVSEPVRAEMPDALRREWEAYRTEPHTHAHLSPFIDGERASRTMDNPGPFAQPYAGSQDHARLRAAFPEQFANAERAEAAYSWSQAPASRDPYGRDGYSHEYHAGSYGQLAGPSAPRRMPGGRRPL